VLPSVTVEVVTVTVVEVDELLVEVAEDSTVVVDVTEDSEVVVEVVVKASVELAVLSEERLDDVEVWDTSEVEREDVDDSVATVDVVTSVVDIVEGDDVELVMLSVVIVKTGVEVVGISVDAELMDDDTDADSTEVAVVEPGISVDVTMGTEVVAKVDVETGGADSEVIEGTVSVDA